MGGGGSKSSQIFHPPQDKLFKLTACVGLTRDEYSQTKRLSNAPFYSVFFTGNTYLEIYANIINTIITTSAAVAAPTATATTTVTSDTTDTTDTTTTTSTPSSSATTTTSAALTALAAAVASVAPQQMPGPVYMFSSIDQQTNIVQCYMYFPSINKTNMKKWENYAEVGKYHSWMSRLIHNPLYSFSAESSCKKYTNDQYGLVYGCSTETGDACMQSKAAHGRMQIYSNDKKTFQYPSVYFKANILDCTDHRVSPYIDCSTLMTNVLAAGSEIYATGNAPIPLLKSPSNTATFVFMDTLFAIVLNGATVNFARRIHGIYKTKAVIEDEYFNISSSSGPSSEEDPLYALKITSQNALQPIALVLDDDGSLSVIDRNNTKSLVIGADGQLAPGVTETGADPVDVGDINAMDANTDADIDGTGGNGEGGYDDVADFKFRLERLRDAIQQHMQGRT